VGVGWGKRVLNKKGLGDTGEALFVAHGTITGYIGRGNSLQVGGKSKSNEPSKGWVCAEEPPIGVKNGSPMKEILYTERCYS